MSLDTDAIRDAINSVWSTAGPVLVVVAAVLALALAVVVVVALLRATLRVIRWAVGRIRAATNAKLTVGFAVVQAGVTVAVVTGVYEFFGRILGLPLAEALIIAVFIEATVWVAVGQIKRYRSGKPTTEHGLGPAGPFFWVATVGGGALAVLGSDTLAAAAGRA